MNNARSIWGRNDSMQKANCPKKTKTVLWLLLIYTSSVVIRYLMALATRNFPTVYIDEYLYYSLGRSIATKGSLLYMGQPAIYNYIIYPLIISPVYLLFGHGTDYFRAIELWNIILMSLSVFPIFSLSNSMVQKKKTALWLTGLFMLLPCFILGEYVFSEAIIYPLFYSLMYCIYRYLKDNKIKYTVWIGILGALLYCTKPGAVMPALFALLLFGGKAIKKKSGQGGIQVLAGLGCLALLFVVIKLIAEKVLGYSGSLLSIYDDQSPFSESASNDYFYNTVGKYPYYFILAGGILPLLVSLWYYPEYKKEDKQYYLLAIICSVLTMIGTAWVVNRPEHMGFIILRYVEMYLPVLYIFIMLPGREQQKLQEHKSFRMIEILCVIILAYVAVCTFTWGSTTGISYPKDIHYMISLAILLFQNVTGLANILIAFLTGTTLYLLFRKTEKQMLIKICCIFLTIFAILNNIEGYLATGNNTSKRREEGTAEVYRMIGDKEYVHIYAAKQSDYGLDINSHYNICWATEDDFLNNLMSNHGCYVPFVPSSARGMTAINQTPDTDTIILDENVYQRIKLSNGIEGYISPTQSFQVIQFNKGERIVDYALTQIQSSNDKYKPYALMVFNEEFLTHPVKIRLEIVSPEDQEVVITADVDHAAQLKKGRYWYEIKTTNPVAEYYISKMNNDIQFCNYEVTILEQTE